MGKPVPAFCSSLDGGTASLAKLQEVLQKHPGPALVSFQFQLSSNIEADSTPIPNLTVLPSEHLVNDIEQILGKESITFHHSV